MSGSWHNTNFAGSVCPDHGTIIILQGVCPDYGSIIILLGVCPDHGTIIILQVVCVPIVAQ